MSEAIRPIDPTSVGKVNPPADLGPLSRLVWIDIADLRVDPLYQREISVKGRRNVRAIAEAFSWSKFAPVVVAALPPHGLLYAIVDGQHRTTAAAAIGLGRVPCIVIAADAGEQAQAFRAINAATTRVHPVQLFKAALAAGDARALAVATMCREAGVRILGYAIAGSALKAHETVSVEALHRLALAKPDLARAVLRGIASQGVDGANLLRSVIIDTLRCVLTDHPAFFADETRFVSALDEIDLDNEWRLAMARKARERGISAVDALYARLVTALSREIKGAA
jgi:hypothetical protein